MKPVPTSTKTAQLVAFMRAGDWGRALSLASTFRLLGEHRVVIHRAHAARTNPSFYRGLGRDPEATVRAGISALQTLYPERPPTTEDTPCRP